MLICCVLIETYWNVKYSVCGWKNIPSVVLIETYWNVKIGNTQTKRVSRAVLIETYWNVKKPDSEPKLDSESNINRNILECKVRKNTKSTTH